MPALTPHEARIAADGAACMDMLREHDSDRYYSTLFAPADKRANLVALYAFNAEIVQVRRRVSEPLPGEVRLQWWRDTIAASASLDMAAKSDTGHPVAVSLLRTIQRFRLPHSAFEALIDAHVFDLYSDPMPCLADLEGYAGETSSALIRLASLILADGTDPGPADAAGHAGVAIALTDLLRGFAFDAAHGHVLLPADVMARHGVTCEAVLRGQRQQGLSDVLGEMRLLARHHIAEFRAVQGALPKQVVPAFLPVQLCEPYLRQMDASDYDPFRSRIERMPLARLWTLWRGIA